MAPLPYTHSGAQIPFELILAIFALLELRTRVRSSRNPRGSRSDRRSLAVVHASVVVGWTAAFALAGGCTQRRSGTDAGRCS